jgi:hypothetical protein
MISYKTIHKQNTIIIITITVRVTKRTATRSTTTATTTKIDINSLSRRDTSSLIVRSMPAD